ncbi:lipase family protein, partial [Corynebacterium frankenforstense]|uniref:lipase family protein n=1 Tax=Corynebacterium frankenforstense TaxID=1230998 RepID=UPI002550A2FB
MGTVAPSAPIMVMTNADDDLVPEPQATQLAEDYCAVGAQVEYRRVVVPGSPTQPLSSGRLQFTPHVPGSG